MSFEYIEQETKQRKSSRKPSVPILSTAGTCVAIVYIVPLTQKSEMIGLCILHSVEDNASGSTR